MGDVRTVATCALAPGDEEHARSAGRWIPAFHPGVHVKVAEGAAILASDLDDQNRLRAVWRAGLLNERLVAAGDARRAGVLDALVR